YSVEDYEYNWDINKITIENEEEPYFYASTVTKTEPVVGTDKNEFQPVISPDGKKMAYLEERNILKVYNMETDETTTVIPEGVNYSYSDGDQYYSWSPDSRWILATSNEGRPRGFVGGMEVDLIKADGSGKRINITKNGFSDNLPKWGLEGKAMFWVSGREGLKNMNRGGQGGIYVTFFDKEAYDRFKLSKQELSLLKKKEEEKDDKEEEEDKKEEEVEKLNLNLDNLEERTQRITLNSSRLSDFVVSDDGEDIYYLANYEGKYNLWVTHPRIHETKVLAHLNAHTGGSLAFSKGEDEIVVLAGGRINTVEVSSGKVKPAKISARMELDPAGERTYILGHAWQQVKDKLVYPDINGVDWDGYYQYYKQFLPYINNDYDFRHMFSEFLGELNVSHTGARYSPDFDNPDQTASLGMLYDLKQGGNGLVVKEVINNGPMAGAIAEVRPNDVLTAIDGTKITDDFDWAKLLNHKADTYTRLSFRRPENGQTRDEVIKPISQGQEAQLMYERWLSTMNAMTDSISDGEIG